MTVTLSRSHVSVENAMQGPVTATRRWSLRQRMTCLLFSLVIAMWTLSAFVIYHQAEKESQELFDASIAETASLLLFFSEHELAEVGESKTAGDDRPADGQAHYLSFQLWDFNNKLRYRSANAPETALAPLDQQGFGWQEVEGELIRTYNRLDSNGIFRIVVAEPMKHRREITGHFLGSLVIFSLFLIPLALFAVRILVSRALGPINRCVKQVNAIDPRKLEPIATEGLPVEISPMVDALNRGLQRIKASITREKRFTADAAHELRTPLASIKTNVQLLSKSPLATNDDDNETLNDALVGVERCSRMITQLLALSQSESSQMSADNNQPVRLQQVISEVQAMEQHKADLKAIGVNWPQTDAVIRGNRDGLILLLRNLVSNAINYTQAGGRVEVSLQQTAGGITLAVSDNGPGISASDRSHVFDRFVRLKPHQSEGSGLGLSICSEIAALHGANLNLTDGLDGKGITFSITLRQ